MKFHGPEELIYLKGSIKTKAVKYSRKFSYSIIEEPQEEEINYRKVLKFFDIEELIKNKLIDKRVVDHGINCENFLK
jgi:hypothetical protein